MATYLRVRLILAVLAALWATSAAATDLRRDFVWSVSPDPTPGSDPKAGLVAREPGQRGGTYENVMLVCAANGVTLHLSPVDRKGLAQAFLRDASLDVTLITDGQAHEFGKPRIVFNEMDEIWGYEITAQNVDVLRAMARARSIRASGEGLDQQIPVDAGTLGAFADACDRRADKAMRSQETRHRGEAPPRAPDGFQPVRTVAVAPPAAPHATTVAEDERAIADLQRQIARLGSQAKALRETTPTQVGDVSALQRAAQPAKTDTPDTNALMRHVKALSDAQSGRFKGDLDMRDCRDDAGCQLLVLAGRKERLGPEIQAALTAEMRYRATGTIPAARERVGDCHATTITRLGDAFDGPLKAPDADGETLGVNVVYAKRLMQLGRGDVPEIRRSRVGDRVSLCLVSMPRGCPRGDDRGKLYLTLNQRTGETWRLGNSNHLCGGA